MIPITKKEIGDNSICPKCNKPFMYETETDEFVERWCSVCDYEFKFEKKLMRD